MNKATFVSRKNMNASRPGLLGITVGLASAWPIPGTSLRLLSRTKLLGMLAEITIRQRSIHELAMARLVARANRVNLVGKPSSTGDSSFPAQPDELH